jgi:hypothetical protein
MSSYSEITKKTTRVVDEDASTMKVPYGWTYLKFDQNNNVLRYDNYCDVESENGFETNYSIRRGLYYKDLNRLIRYRIKDQERNHDQIYFDDIIEEFGDFDTIPQDDLVDCDDVLSDSDDSI